LLCSDLTRGHLEIKKSAAEGRRIVSSSGLFFAQQRPAMKTKPIMKPSRIYFSISIGLILTLLLTFPTFAELLKFQGWAIENDDQDPTIYNACNFIALSPDNKQVYTPHYNRKVLGFNRNTVTGKLNFIQSHMDGVAGVECLSSVFAIQVSADGKHVYTVSLHDNGLSVFSRDQNTGKLTFMECYQENKSGVNGMISPWSLVLSPDDKYVYAAGCDSHAVAVFSRNPLTGRLAFVEAQVKGRNGVEGLGGITSLTITPDNKHLYAVGSRDATLTVFSRDIVTGKLTLVETQKNGFSGVAGLANAQCVIASRDGKNIYTAGFQDAALAVFSRDIVTGKLTFREAQKNNFKGVKGLNGIVALALSPDQKYLYAVSQGDHSLTVFRRNEQTGRLTFVEAHQSGRNGVYGFLTPQQVTVSADGKHIYIINRSKSGEKPVLFSMP
jgi:6-phosphogluconolactonase (cycloisomerase 2 family)